MNAEHGLSPECLSKIELVLESFPAVERAVLFGSRAKGTAKPGSDIDLALVGGEIDWQMIGVIYDRLDDLLLPYRFSLIHREPEMDENVAAHIERVGITIYNQSSVSR